MNGLSLDLQRDTVRAIYTHVNLYGRPPTRRELFVPLGLRSSCSVDNRLRLLAREGYVLVDPYLCRGLTITPRGLALIGAPDGELALDMADPDLLRGSWPLAPWVVGVSIYHGKLIFEVA